MINEEDLQMWLEKVTADECSGLVRIYDSWSVQYQHLASKLSSLSNGVPDFNK
jgi:hypothetical protein